MEQSWPFLYLFILSQDLKGNNYEFCIVIKTDLLTNLPQVLIRELGRNTGMLLAWF